VKHTRGIFQALVLSSVVLFSIPAEGIAEVRDSGTGNRDAPVQLSRVVLFSSGVGYFQHRGYVEGEAEVRLSFPLEEMKDILKSFVLQDHDGGSVELIHYESKEPLSRSLESFSLDLSGSTRIEDLLMQAKGEEVELRGTKVLKGRILAIEQKRKEKEGPQIAVLHLLSNGLLRTMSMEEVESVRFTDPQLQNELEQALTLIASERSRDTKSVRVEFSGEGRRRVSIGYLRPVPVWKTSYRLIEENGSYRLQGWGVVENTSDTDWSGVELSLVAGTPLSFIMDLYSPIYAERPEISPPVAKMREPKQYEPQYDDFAASESAAPAPMRKRSAPRSMEDTAAGYGSAGVDSRSVGTDMGALFSYDITEPVTVPKNSSAMVPIIVSDVGATEVSVYSANEESTNPLAGLLLENTSDSHLHAGPYTVYREGGYAGDALASDIVPGEERLLTFAVDRDLVVLSDERSREKRVVKMRIEGGTFVYTELDRRSTVYRVMNRGDETKRLIIEHPKSSGWRLVSPSLSASGAGSSNNGSSNETGAAETPSAYRFERQIDDLMQLEVEEERPHTRRVSLGTVEDDRVEFFLQNFDLSAELRSALEKIRNFHLRISKLERQKESAEGEIRQIHDEQSRIRSNMSRISNDSDLYRRYVKKFQDQEDRIEELTEEKERLTGQINGLRDELRGYVSELDV